ncbi:MAG: tetratricopeptide repeat protein [Deltaproteobacteria bacterium]|nr:tetratricopeptide repeat protein [Deltaproteobacteria bacterium]
MRLILLRRIKIEYILITSIFLVSCSGKIQNASMLNSGVTYLEEFLNKANVELNRENYPQTSFLARKALEIDPCNSIALDILGLSLLKQGSIQESLHYFETAISCNPSYFKALTHLSAAYYILGDFEKARLFFLKAHDIYPMDLEISELKQVLVKEGLITAPIDQKGDQYEN